MAALGSQKVEFLEPTPLKYVVLDVLDILSKTPHSHWIALEIKKEYIFLFVILFLDIASSWQGLEVQVNGKLSFFMETTSMAFKKEKFCIRSDNK